MATPFLLSFLMLVLPLMLVLILFFKFYFMYVSIKEMKKSIAHSFGGSKAWCQHLLGAGGASCLITVDSLLEHAHKIRLKPKTGAQLAALFFLFFFLF